MSSDETSTMRRASGEARDEGDENAVAEGNIGDARRPRVMEILLARRDLHDLRLRPDPESPNAARVDFQRIFELVGIDRRDAAEQAAVARGGPRCPGGLHRPGHLLAVEFACHLDLGAHGFEGPRHAAAVDVAGEFGCAGVVAGERAG
jgi:hypothetical protein